MANIVSYHSYKLQEGASVPDFLLAMDKLLNEFVGKQKGFISSYTLVDEETWADFQIWKTIDDLEAFIPLCDKNELAKASCAFMDFGTLKSHTFSVEQSYNLKRE